MTVFQHTACRIGACLIIVGVLLRPGMPGAESADPAGKVVFYAPHWCLEEYEADSKAFVAARPLVRKILNTPNITFDISYEDAAGVGFFDPADGARRMQRLEEALAYAAAVLNMPGELEVRVEPSLNTVSGTLASAGTFYSTVTGFSNGTAFQRLSTGTKPFPTFPEIRVIVNFGYNWNTSTNPPSASQFDFLTVMVHEITHGLGFASLAGSTGTSLISAGVYSVFDSFLVRATGSKRLITGSPPVFTGTTDDLRSRDIIMDGASSESLYAQGVEPGIYAPNPFSLGSSLSHWDTGNIVGKAVMEHAFPTGFSKRAFAPLDLGALRDIGYTSAASAPAPGGEGEGEGEGEVNAAVRVSMRDEAINVPVTNATARLDPVSVTTTNNVNGTYTFTVTTAGTYKVSATATGYRAEQTPNFVVNSGTSQVNLTLELEPLPPATLSVSPNPGGGQNFGSVAQGESAEVNFVVTNSGGGRLTGAASVSGAGFSALGNTNYLLAQGQNVTITIRFTPTAAGAFSGTATFTNTAGSNISINLAGSGAAAPPPPPPPTDGCGCGTTGAPRHGSGGALLALLAALALAGLAQWRPITAKN